MSLQGKQLAFWEFATEPCVTGKSKGKSRQSGRREVNADMTLPPIQLALPGIGLSSSTPASHRPSKKKTLSVSVSISNLNILKEKLSAKLEAASTTSDSNFLAYWSGSCQEMSNSLWSHTKIGSHDLASTCLSGSVPSTLAKSWFSTKLNYLPRGKWLKTSLQSWTAFQLDCTGSENTHLKSHKIGICSEPSLHRIWKQWRGASKYCFNRAIAYQPKGEFISKYDLRKVGLGDDNLSDWVTEIPAPRKINALMDVCAAFKFRERKGLLVQKLVNSLRFEVEYN